MLLSLAWTQWLNHMKFLCWGTFPTKGQEFPRRLRLHSVFAGKSRRTDIPRGIKWLRFLSVMSPRPLRSSWSFSPFLSQGGKSCHGCRKDRNTDEVWPCERVLERRFFLTRERRKYVWLTLQLEIPGPPPSSAAPLRNYPRSGRITPSGQRPHDLRFFG